MSSPYGLFKIQMPIHSYHSEDRVRAGAAKLAKMLAAKQQGRLDGFFTVKPKEGGGETVKKTGDKRKGDDKVGAKKKGKK